MVRSRTENTLFMLMSVDGKISTGDRDVLDFDQDLPHIRGVKEGLFQYYDLEKLTDLCSLNTGRVQAKIGVNKKKEEVTRLPVNFVVIDNKPYLTATGVDYFLRRSSTFYLVTTNKKHPAYRRTDAHNLRILHYPRAIDFEDLFTRLKQEYHVDRVTIQSGGTLNAIFLRQGLIDHVSVVMAPVLVGGKDTSTLIDGESLHGLRELAQVKALTLKRCSVLEHGYLHLVYDVINKTTIVK